MNKLPDYDTFTCIILHAARTTELERKGQAGRGQLRKFEGL